MILKCLWLTFFRFPVCYVVGQGAGTSRTYFQGQRLDPKSLEKKNIDHLDLLKKKWKLDMRIIIHDSSKTFEDLEKKFLDDIMKLAKEQNDAEDAENARQREVCT